MAVSRAFATAPWPAVAVKASTIFFHSALPAMLANRIAYVLMSLAILGGVFAVSMTHV